MVRDRDMLRAERKHNMAGPVVERDLCRMGKSDRSPVPRTRAGDMGGGGGPLERERGAIAGG